MTRKNKFLNKDGYINRAHKNGPPTWRMTLAVALPVTALAAAGYWIARSAIKSVSKIA